MTLIGEIFEDLFREGINNNVDREKWKTITRLGFIPRVVEWISDIVENKRPRENLDRDVSTVNDFLTRFAELRTFKV